MNYQKPTLEKFGTFRDLTRLGFSSASDGASICGVTTSPGCVSVFDGRTYETGCPADATAS